MVLDPSLGVLRMNALSWWQIPLINLILSFFPSDISESIQHQFNGFAICEFVAAVVILDSRQPALDHCHRRQFSLVLNTCFVFTSVLAHLELSGARSNCGHRAESKLSFHPFSFEVLSELRIDICVRRLANGSSVAGTIINQVSKEEVEGAIPHCGGMEAA